METSFAQIAHDDAWAFDMLPASGWCTATPRTRLSPPGPMRLGPSSCPEAPCSTPARYCCLASSTSAASHGRRTRGPSRLADGRVSAAGGKVVPLSQVRRRVVPHAPQDLPANVDPAGLEASTGFKPRVDTGTFTYATHAVAVAVDPETGQVEILDYVIVEDCGTMVNPMIVEGQTYRRHRTGHRHRDVRREALRRPRPAAGFHAGRLHPAWRHGSAAIRIEHFETPSPHTEFGAKGVGEGGAIAPPAVIFNAVNDALRGTGAAEVLMTPPDAACACSRPSTSREAATRSASMKAAKFDIHAPVDAG